MGDQMAIVRDLLKYKIFIIIISNIKLLPSIPSNESSIRNFIGTPTILY